MRILTAAAALLLTGCATKPLAESVTLKYQHPGVGVHHQHHMAQAFVHNVIDENYQLDTDARREGRFISTETVVAVPEGFRVSSGLDGWEMGNRKPALARVKFQLKNDMSGNELDTAFDRFMRLNPPSYIVNSNGDFVKLLVTKAYKERVRTIAQEVLDDADGLTAKTKQRYAQLFDGALNELEDEQYLSYVERLRVELNALSGMTLKLNGEPTKGITLYKQRPDDHRTKVGSLQFTGHSACSDDFKAEGCIVLKHVEIVDEVTEKTDGITETTLIVDPDTLQVYSSIAIPKNTQLKKYFSEQLWGLPLAVSSQRRLTNDVDDAKLAKTRNDIAKVGGFVQRSAEWDDFVTIYARQVDDLLDFERCEPSPDGVYSEKCNLLHQLYASEKQMRLYSHFEQVGMKENKTDEGTKVLRQLNKLFERRIMQMAGFEVARTYNSRWDANSKEFILEASEKALSLIPKSPITGQRHKDYLVKLELFLQELSKAIETGGTPPAKPKR